MKLIKQIIRKIVDIIQIIVSYLLFIFGLICSLIVLPFQLIFLALTNKEKSNSNQNTDSPNSSYTYSHYSNNLKKVITAIEFYKIKNKDYPNNINENTFEMFLEQWIFLYDEHDYLLEFIRDDLTYSLQENGYELNLDRENNNIELELPPAFWEGLGVVKTNIKGFIPVDKNPN